MNIYDIAKACGVSIATVSRVLNGSDKVRPQTREKILAVMKEHNYTPNSMARGLGTGYTRMVGLVCTDLKDAFYAPAVGYATEVLQQRGMTPLLRTVGDDPEEKKQAMDELANQGVDGILLVGPSFTEEDEPAIYQAAQRAPVVSAGGNINMPGVSCVVSDERGAVAELVASLFGRQRRNILLLHRGDTYASREMIAGYRDGYAAADYPVDDTHILSVGHSLEAVNTCIKQLLMQRVNFDAVIGADDLLALGAQRALQRIGLSMPVIGCNNSLLAQCSAPELTSIDNHIDLVCATAADLLCRCLQGEDIPPYTAIPTTLMERDTFRRN